MVIDIVISSKKRDSLSLQMDQTRASHSFDPDSDLSESGFLDLITISLTLLYFVNEWMFLSIFVIRTKYKELHDLRGHSFGFSSSKSISASISMLEQLKKMGVDASFFGSLYESGT